MAKRGRPPKARNIDEAVRQAILIDNLRQRAEPHAAKPGGLKKFVAEESARTGISTRTLYETIRDARRRHITRVAWASGHRDKRAPKTNPEEPPSAWPVAPITLVR